MSKGRILVVDDDFDISNMLRIYFTGQGYAVEVAPRGSDAIAATRKQLPNLIVLDINLPDITGYDVCRMLRQNTRTSYIPIIFLTQKDERIDKLTALEVGGDDFITKPFDIEELKLRVQNSIESSRRISQIDSKSNLPLGPLVEEHLRTLMRDASRDWSYIDVKISNFEMFSEVYGWAAADEVIRFTAMIITGVVEEMGTSEDYIGHPSRDNFVIVSHSSDPERLQNRLIDRFANEIKQHYTFIDRERGYMLVPSDDNGEKRVDLMAVTIGAVSTRTHHFSDIREITELAAEARRRNKLGEDKGGSWDDLPTAW